MGSFESRGKSSGKSKNKGSGQECPLHNNPSYLAKK
jgi:hypothetical protein